MWGNPDVSIHGTMGIIPRTYGIYMANNSQLYAKSAFHISYFCGADNKFKYLQTNPYVNVKVFSTTVGSGFTQVLSHEH